MTAYTDATKIAAYLGVTLTVAQITQAGVLAQAASDWIDEYKGRSWQDHDGSVSNEVQSVIGDAVWLAYRPIVAVSAVATRQPVVGAAWNTLAAGQWEIADASAGQLRLTGWGNYEARISYTHSATAAPSQIALAATMIAASWLHPTLNPSTAGIDAISVGQNDVNVKFSKDARTVPDAALTLLGSRAVVVA